MSAADEVRRLNVFERYLSVWVALCMAAGVGLGKAAPGLIEWLRGLEFGAGSQINVPIAVLIWLMIYPMMLKVNFASVMGVRKRPRGLVITLVVNWLVKPFSMALLGWVFFKHVFTPWIGPDLADQYVAGVIILAAAPCTAMVFVWSYLTRGDPAYTLVQVSVNDLIMLILFAPIVKFLVSGASSLTVPFLVLLYAVVFFIVIPLSAGAATRVVLIRRRGVFAAVSTGGGERATGDARSDFRVPGGQHHGPVPARGADCDPDPDPGLFQFIAGVWVDEGVPGSPFGSSSGGIDRGEQFF